ncbi:FAD-dependent oxidoreductase, partial [Streptomyces lasiicapitis]|uniref:FAD-dependent oxidoreductase n=1 Tax=Streptomyces lasiicapitis TaxID=1923961 RepID=UPI00368543F7
MRSGGAVLGGGPAVVGGADTPAELGLSVALVDSSTQVGGQFYRTPEPVLGAVRPESLHHDWAAFAGLRTRQRATSGITHLAGHHVWTVARQGDDLWAVHAVTGADGAGERPVCVRARTILIATGAYERQLPFPGWTLPGVVGGGGPPTLQQTGPLLPGRCLLVAGSGRARQGVGATR